MRRNVQSEKKKHKNHARKNHATPQKTNDQILSAFVEYRSDIIIIPSYYQKSIILKGVFSDANFFEAAPILCIRITVFGVLPNNIVKRIFCACARHIPIVPRAPVRYVSSLKKRLPRSFSRSDRCYFFQKKRANCTPRRIFGPSSPHIAPDAEMMPSEYAHSVFALVPLTYTFHPAP